MTINTAALDELLKQYKTPAEILGENGLLKQLTKAVLERALQAEMTHHLGHEKHGSLTTKGGNSRNGTSAKTLKGDFGNMPIARPTSDLKPSEERFGSKVGLCSLCTSIPLLIMLILAPKRAV